MLTTSHLLNQ